MFNYLKQQLCNYDKAQVFYSVFREKNQLSLAVDMNRGLM